MCMEAWVSYLLPTVPATPPERFFRLQTPVQLGITTAEHLVGEGSWKGYQTLERSTETPVTMFGVIVSETRSPSL